MDYAPIQSILVPLTAVLGLSLTVERILEFSKNLLERLLGVKDIRTIPSLKESDEKIARLEAIYQKESVIAAAEQNPNLTRLNAQLTGEGNAAAKKQIRMELLKIEEQGQWDEAVTGSVILVRPASDADDGSTLRVLILQILGLAAGIILAHYSGIRLFKTFLNALGQEVNMPAALDYLFTGLLIGAGSTPMHFLISFITQRKITIDPDAPAAEEKQTVMQSVPAVKSGAPAIHIKPVVSEAEAIDVPYDGGVDVETLESVHRRKANPDMIVYHHTAMNSKSAFQDVVQVIKNRGWITGYNCVVQYDGSIHPFCRWDRYGNHATGYNMRSLGLSFNGNFETDPRVPFSNPSGKMGPSRPSELQLKSGARVIALWSMLYGIDLDWDTKIIPHKQVANKTCPGSSFPYDEFRRQTEYYRQLWMKSEYAKEQLAAFKLKPYLFVQGR